MPESSGWAMETMRIINDLTPTIEGKSFDPGWFMLRQRLEQQEALTEDLLKACSAFLARYNNKIVNADLLFGDIAEMASTAIAKATQMETQ